MVSDDFIMKSSAAKNKIVDTLANNLVDKLRRYANANTNANSTNNVKDTGLNKQKRRKRRNLKMTKLYQLDEVGQLLRSIRGTQPKILTATAMLMKPMTVIGLGERLVRVWATLSIAE